jgi:hypothetical protein
MVTERQVLFRSKIMLTPYLSSTLIDLDQVQHFIANAYREARLQPDDIDTGAVIITGEALKKENAQPIVEYFAQYAGKFICATAGHNHEALLAAYGSGAVDLAQSERKTVLNVDMEGGTTVRAEHTAELFQAPNGTGEEHEAELTDHGVEGAVSEWQRLTIHHYWSESRTGKPGMCCVEHRQRNVGADYESRRPDLGKRHRRCLARPCRDVKYSVSRDDLRSSQHRRHEEARPIPNVLVVCRAVDVSSHCRMESWSEVHAHGYLTVFWCIHAPSALRACLHDLSVPHTNIRQFSF